MQTFIAQASFKEKVSYQADNNSIVSLEYWSDEEDRYPPQMSLSPPPCESRFRKTTLSVNETRKYNDKKIPRYFKSNDDFKVGNETNILCLHKELH